MPGQQAMGQLRLSQGNEFRENAQRREGSSGKMEMLTKEESSHTHNRARELFPRLEAVPQNPCTHLSVSSGAQAPINGCKPSSIEFLPSTSAWKILLHPLKPNPCTTPTKSSRPAQVLLPHGPQAAGPLSTLDGGAKGPQPGNTAGAEAVFDSTVSETCGCLAQKQG